MDEEAPMTSTDEACDVKEAPREQAVSDPLVKAPTFSTETLSTCHQRQVQLWTKIASYTVVLLLLAYVITTLLGFASLETPDDPIEDPYFTIMEVLILLVMPCMVVSFGGFHYIYSQRQMYSMLSLLSMLACAIITSAVHFVVLTVSRDIEQYIPYSQYLFSFTWPSVVYALDILAWDWFFALSMLSGALVVRWHSSRMEKALKVCMILSGVLSFLGLIAVPLDNMQVRIIGIVGYAVVSIPIFVLLGLLVGRTTAASRDDTVKHHHDDDDDDKTDEVPKETV